MSAKLKETAPAKAGPTPMMAQYLAVKAQYPDCLLFYRMGDFFEMFFDDALQASRALDITLTRRGQQGDDDIPMCGVPVHSHETYLARLIKAGFRVAICDQVETPEEAKRRGGYKALVQREVVRVVTAGTITEDTLLERHANNYLAAIAKAGEATGLAWLDLSTGEFTLQPVMAEGLGAALERLQPGEVLLPDTLPTDPAFQAALLPWQDRLTPLPRGRFDSDNARKRMEAAFGTATLESFGAFSRAEVSAAGTLLDYVELTQKGRVRHLRPPRQMAAGQVMEIDAATRRNLELTRTLSGEREGSLLHTIDRTQTAAGARLLAAWLSAPLASPAAITQRLDSVAFLAGQPALRQEIRDTLASCPDMERALARLALGRGGPRDLACLRDTLAQSGPILRRLTQGDAPLPEVLRQSAEALQPWGAHHPLVDRLCRALAPELPVLARDGNFIARGYAPHLDELRTLRDEGRRVIAGLQQKYIESSGVSALKIKHNNILGYFIEVTATHGDRLLSHEDKLFIHRQTLANAARFTTVELSEIERKILEAADKALAAEQEIFTNLVADVLEQSSAIHTAAHAIAAIDCFSALAELAAEKSFCRPVVDDSLAFDIRGGRHPVVEVALKKADGADFIPNGCKLEDGQSIWLLTGPNMAGKSTFLRQNALIAILAQTGSFVPAEQAHIGIVDRVFSRVGAADDLARGRSTFMVEMVETAAILNQATARSLVILDEIGRGTATFDGLSIAWATIEYLHDVNRCRALFATHYHELTTLAEKLERLSCHTMKIREWQDQVIFLHEVASGTADRSYGIHVARIAGLPPAVIARAGEILRRLETGGHSGGGVAASMGVGVSMSAGAGTGIGASAAVAQLAQDLPLFTQTLQQGRGGSHTAQTVQTEEEHPVLARLRDVRPDDLSPREALDILYALKSALPPEPSEA